MTPRSSSRKAETSAISIGWGRTDLVDAEDRETAGVWLRAGPPTAKLGGGVPPVKRGEGLDAAIRRLQRAGALPRGLHRLSTGGFELGRELMEEAVSDGADVDPGSSRYLVINAVQGWIPDDSARICSGSAPGLAGGASLADLPIYNHARFLPCRRIKRSHPCSAPTDGEAKVSAIGGTVGDALCARSPSSIRAPRTSFLTGGRPQPLRQRVSQRRGCPVLDAWNLRGRLGAVVTCPRGGRGAEHSRLRGRGAFRSGVPPGEATNAFSKTAWLSARGEQARVVEPMLVDRFLEREPDEPRR